MDITDRDNAKVVATFYDRVALRDFTQQVLVGLKKFNPLVVVESNSYGLAIIENLREDGYIHMYRRTKYDKISNRWTEHLGFATTQQSRPILLSRLHQWVSKQKLDPVCVRLKTEMNTFVYNEKGKPEADKGKHDDLVIATGLALMGLDQVADYEEEVQKSTRPQGIRATLEWEMNTGKLYSEEKGNFHDGLEDPQKHSSPLNNI